MKNSIHFVKMENTKSLSLTGNYCYLNCKHCNKHYLNNMITIKDIDKISNMSSILLSGGMNDEIKVPVYNFVEILQEYKNKYNFKYNLHTGFMNYNELEKIKAISDAISFDLVGNKETMINVYGIDKFENMWSTFDNLIKLDFKVKPHITIGLNGGKLTHEKDAINRLKKYDIDEIIFLVFIPTKGSAFENENPPKIEEVVEIFEYAKEKIENIKLTLGCMHPKGKYRKELQENLLYIADKIVQPVQNTIELAKKMNFNITWSYECCVF
ncbi:radical SAM protein [Marinitoga sp. 38H-ov]|uniref:radical SAM protein n=1 Tax=Marinitoga sp. 38H-ov TaxID=1755814 RepID=UPI0013EA6D21|nr:radical SAM protein [Marinitoga sp. 38H-ov]KAF2956440.1 radical SAM protein [Marinitoga sp. 38H-ov]